MKALDFSVDLYHEKTYWMIRKMILSHDSTNDVLQETYVRIFKGIENFKRRVNFLLGFIELRTMNLSDF